MSAKFDGFFFSDMAKSLRSKRKRKMRAIKRVKNAPKELARLKKILPASNPVDEEMKELVQGNSSEWRILSVSEFLSPLKA